MAKSERKHNLAIWAKLCFQSHGPCPLCFCLNGGADGIRTHDLRLAKALLSQLSYSPVSDCFAIVPARACCCQRGKPRISLADLARHVKRAPGNPGTHLSFLFDADNFVLDGSVGRIDLDDGPDLLAHNRPADRGLVGDPILRRVGLKCADYAVLEIVAVLQVP